MAVFIPFPNCAEAVIQGVMAGQDVLLTLGFQRLGGYDPETLSDLASTLAEWTTSTLLPKLVDDWTVLQIKVTDLSTDFAPVAFSSVGLPASGGVVGVPVTSNTAMVVSFKTANRGRSYRGRNYVPAIRADRNVDAGTYSTTDTSEIQSAYYAMQSATFATGDAHVVLSRYTGNAPRIEGVATPVLSYQAKQRVATQRRRVPGRGS
jgi:hypothetical protein